MCSRQRRPRSTTGCSPPAKRTLRETGEALRRGPLKALGGVAGIGLGIAGGVISVVTGNALTGALGAGAAASGVATLSRQPTTPYSYLFAMQRELA
jgi:hypothetical protein